MATTISDLLKDFDLVDALDKLGGGAATIGATVGASELFDDLFGTSVEDVLKPITDYQDTALALDAGGLQGQLVDGVYTVSPTDSRRAALVSDMQLGLGDYANELGALREQLTPGFGELTKARVDRLENQKRKAVGDLRENLARRRLGGSSFAGDAEARVAREYDVPIAEAAAQSFLEELQLSSNLLQLESNANIASAKVALDELNAQLNLAAGSAGQLTSAMANLASAQANILSSVAIESNALQEKFINTILESLGLA